MLGIIVPEFDAAAVEWGKPLPSAANPILPLNLRPGLLAGVAIVERANAAAMASKSSSDQGFITPMSLWMAISVPNGSDSFCRRSNIAFA